MSPGLKRAREPYLLKNAIVGLALGAFAVGVWAYSISAVRQDVFDDVDEEAQALAAPGTTAALVTPLLKETVQPPVSVLAKADAAQSAIEKTNATQAAGPARGVLQHLGPRLPWLLDPARKTIVWGAPPVDNVGKMSRS